MVYNLVVYYIALLLIRTDDLNGLLHSAKFPSYNGLNKELVKLKLCCMVGPCSSSKGRKMGLATNKLAGLHNKWACFRSPIS